jgi:hypothetical protein
MIIGINGKMGSGKDTAGSIIQYLTLCKEHNIIDLSYDEFVNSTGWLPYWEIKKFAGKLKQIASLLTGIPVEKFEDQEFKKVILGEEWGTVRHNPLNNIEPFAKFQFNELMSVREFLQRLGTEAMRDGLHTNIWVNALFADYISKPEFLGSAYEESGKTEIYPNWIITDMRFENELEAVVKHKGITIRVVRPGRTLTGTHPSETSLDGFIMHYEIINDGTIEDLVEKVREILIKENII